MDGNEIKNNFKISVPDIHIWELPLIQRDWSLGLTAPQLNQSTYLNSQITRQTMMDCSKVTN